MYISSETYGEPETSDCLEFLLPFSDQSICVEAVDARKKKGHSCLARYGKKAHVK